MLQREAVALGAEPTAYFAPWVLLGVKIAARRERAHALFSWTNVRTLNEGAGLAAQPVIGQSKSRSAAASCQVCFVFASKSTGSTGSETP